MTQAVLELAILLPLPLPPKYCNYLGFLSLFLPQEGGGEGVLVFKLKALHLLGTHFST
jgi:hypothetical protein